MEQESGGTVVVGRRTNAIEEDQVPFFKGWQDNSSAFAGLSGLSGSSGFRPPRTPSPEPSPHTVPTARQEEIQEKGERPILVGGNHNGAGIEQSTTDKSIFSKPVTPPALMPPPNQPLAISLLSDDFEGNSSGGEISDASSLAHMLVRKEMSKRSFKRIMSGPTHLASVYRAPNDAPVRPAPSAPTILMDTSPTTFIEMPTQLKRALTFSEALRSVVDMPSSPTSTLGPLPQMPLRPRYGRGRGNRSSHETAPSSSSRSGRGLNARRQNRSTASSNYSIKRAGVIHPIPIDSMTKTGTDQGIAARVSFATPEQVEEKSVPTKSDGGPTIVFSETDPRRSSFPWASPAKPHEESRRFSYPVEKKQEKSVEKIRPSVLTRFRSAVSRYMSASSSIPPSARSATSRRRSVDELRRNSSRLPSLETESCLDKIGSFFVRHRAELVETSNTILSPFTHDARAWQPRSMAGLAHGRTSSQGEGRVGSSISYHGGDGKHYVMPQVIAKRTTWLPSEMTRINTPPPGQYLEESFKSGSPRGFFFDLRKPPGVENEAGSRQDKQDLGSDLLQIQIRNPPLTPSKSHTSTASRPNLVSSTSRGSLFRRLGSSRRHRGYSNSDTETGDEGRPVPSYFRQKMDFTTDSAGEEEEEEKDVVYDYDIPEHLPNSPLCPENVGIYGSWGYSGKGTNCPVHHGKKNGKSGGDLKKRKDGVKGMKRELSLKDMM